MTAELSAQLASELIGGIHDCALDPSLWPAALDRIRRELGFSTATLDVVALPGFAPILSVAAGIPDRWLARRHDYGPDAAALWGGAARMMAYPLDEPIVQTRAGGTAAQAGNRYYDEWAKPQGLADAVAIRFARDRTMLGCIGMGRHRDAGAVGERELGALRLVAPHVRRAVSIGKLLDRQAAQAHDFAASLDAVAAGIVLVDRDMHVLHANGAAAAMMRTEDAILTRRGMLRIADPDANARLEAAVAAAAAGDEAAPGPRGIGVPLRARAGGPAVAHVLPLRGGKARSALAPRAVAAVFLARGAEPPPLPRAALAALYDLTPAEARVMQLVADGCTLAEAGRAIGVALSTVKTHLQRVFSKTGCRRQVELANLARSLRQPG